MSYPVTKLCLQTGSLSFAIDPRRAIPACTVSVQRHLSLDYPGGRTN